MTRAKDEALAGLADQANVAQFLSVDPTGEQRFVRLREFPREPNRKATPEAVDSLFSRASYGTVNVRSFRAHGPSEARKSSPFAYGVRSRADVLDIVHRNGEDGLYSIVNETVPVEDGGVSGVALGGIVEFSPDDTPRCVEKPGTVALPHDIAIQLLRTVYGFGPDIRNLADQRLEWSIHPRRVGLLHTHTLVWEIEEVPRSHTKANLQWPNNFSRFLGDKVFGLLLADALGAPVPRATVVSRRVAPFDFGRRTGLSERWLRTAPAEPVPGYYPTTFGWHDPVGLLSQVESPGSVSAILAQDGVDASFSGALLPANDGGSVIEGVRGRGDRFMLGEAGPEPLPTDVIKAVSTIADQLAEKLGPIRLEWAMDESGPWILQVQQAAPVGGYVSIVEREAQAWHRFDAALGLDALRDLIAGLEGTGSGIVLAGGVGITSHFGDVLRRAGVPSRLEVGPAVNGGG